MPSQTDPPTDITSFIQAIKKKYRIPKTALSALERHGLIDPRMFLALTSEEIAIIPGVSDRTIEKLQQAAQDLFQGKLFQEASLFASSPAGQCKYCTTGSKALDNLLGGGLPTNSLIELSGEFRTGKTQFCLTCAVTAQLPEDQGGLDSRVIFIDTTHSLNIPHYLAIGKRFGLSEEVLLKNLIVVRAEKLRYFKDAIIKLSPIVSTIDARLIIIDSFTLPFALELEQPLKHPNVQKRLAIFLGQLKRLVNAFHITVLFTTHVEPNFGFGSQYRPVKTVGGPITNHTTDIRLFLKKMRKNKRRARITKCAWLPVEKAEFYLTKYGLYDDEIFPERQVLRMTNTQSNKEQQRTARIQSDKDSE